MMVLAERLVLSLSSVIGRVRSVLLVKLVGLRPVYCESKLSPSVRSPFVGLFSSRISCFDAPVVDLS